MYSLKFIIDLNNGYIQLINCDSIQMNLKIIQLSYKHNIILKNKFTY